MSWASNPPMSAMAARARSTCESRSRATDAERQIAEVFRRLSSIFSRPISAGHHNSGSPAHAVVEIENIRVVHADAAIGHEAADRARLIGAMNGVFPTAQRHRRRAHGIAGGAARYHVRQ